MKTVSNFDRIGEENAFAVLGRAGVLAAGGMDVINLGIGQPDFPTPENIVEAAVKALRDGHHGYTDATGILPLREAVSADLHCRYNTEVSPANAAGGASPKTSSGISPWRASGSVWRVQSSMSGLSEPSIKLGPDIRRLSKLLKNVGAGGLGTISSACSGRMSG